MPSIPKIIIIPAVLVGSILASFILTNWDNNNYNEQFFYGAKNNPPSVFKKENTIDPLIKTSVQKLPGKYAIYIKNLNNQEVYGLNLDEKFPSASLYKLAVMYTTFEALDKGILKKDDLLSQSKVTLDKIIEGNEQETQSPDSTETVSHTVEAALNLMITISDNYSALLLAQKLGWQNIHNLMETQNLSGIDLTGQDSPSVTAQSTGDLLERIYRNKAVNRQSSEEMKKLLFAQKVNDRIPKYLPDDIEVGHKTGELGLVRHDAGIVLGKQNDYIFVILSDTLVPQDAVENIAKIAKSIFEELENQ